MTRRGRPKPLRTARLGRRGGLVGILIVVALLVLRWWHEQPLPPPPETLAEGTFEVHRVVDGDTLLLANGARVRLIGADTPETVRPNHPVEPWGDQATQFTRRFVAEGPVRLQFDGPPKDRHDRFLAYVWVGDRMLNEELIRQGLARAELQYPYSRDVKDRFRRAEDEAKAARRGIWSQ